jgi:hypothetical protein
MPVVENIVRVWLVFISVTPGQSLNVRLVQLIMHRMLVTQFDNIYSHTSFM